MKKIPSQQNLDLMPEYTLLHFQNAVRAKLTLSGNLPTLVPPNFWTIHPRPGALW
jgi:hypothetical protein